MNPSDRTKTRSMSWILLFLVVWLLVSPTQGGQAPDSPDHRQEFLQRFARAYFPGRSGQIMLVPREGGPGVGGQVLQSSMVLSLKAVQASADGRVVYA
jgi:hypothetical protein